MGSDDKIYAGEGPFYKLRYFITAVFEKPIVWFRETIVEPNRQEYYWYHEKIQRVPTIDECYTDDPVCIFEANEQYLRDKKVDGNIVQILQRRLEYCTLEHPNDKHRCNEMREDWQNAVNNFFIKYGDLGVRDSAANCYFKQKHRLAWERRHGPVGSGMRPETEEDVPKKEKKTC